MTHHVGKLGFYKPDPGNCKSPSFVMAESNGKFTVFEVPTQMVFEIDVEEWMPLEEMRKDTLSILNAQHDDMTVPKLRDRIVAMAEAQQFLADRIDSMVAALNQAEEALRNVPVVGEIYDQQHSDTHMAAALAVGRFESGKW